MIPRLCGLVCSTSTASAPRSETSGNCPASTAFDTVPISRVEGVEREGIEEDAVGYLARFAQYARLSGVQNSSHFDLRW